MASSRRKRFARRSTRAPATSRRKRSSASSRPPISAVVRSGRRPRSLARGLSQIAGVEVQEPETNLVFFKPDGAGIAGDKMVAALRQRGVTLAMMDGRIRACTHLDVTAGQIEETIGYIREIVRGA